MPKLPVDVPAPAFDGRVILQREATEDEWPSKNRQGESFTQGAAVALPSNAILK